MQNNSLDQDSSHNKANEDLYKEKLDKLHEKEIDFKNNRNSKIGYALTLVVIASLTALVIMAFNPFLYNQLLANSLSNLPIMIAGVGSISAIAIVAISGSGIAKNEKAKEEKQYDGVHTPEELAKQKLRQQENSQPPKPTNQASSQTSPRQTSWTEAVKGEDRTQTSSRSP